MLTARDRGWGNPYELSRDDMVVFNVAGLLPHHPARLVAVRNSDVGLVFAEAARRLVAAGWPGPDANTWGYNGRLKRWAQDAGQRWGTAPLGSVSEHAWGTAVDFSTGVNPMLSERPRDPWAHTNMPRAAVKIAADLGLTWGGNWSVPYDPQHWEIAGTPADVAATARAIRASNEGEIVDAVQEKRIIDGAGDKAADEVIARLERGSVLKDVGTLRDRTLEPGLKAIMDELAAIRQTLEHGQPPAPGLPT